MKQVFINSSQVAEVHVFIIDGFKSYKGYGFVDNEFSLKRQDKGF